MERESNTHHMILSFLPFSSCCAIFSVPHSRTREVEEAKIKTFGDTLTQTLRAPVRARARITYALTRIDLYIADDDDDKTSHAPGVLLRHPMPVLGGAGHVT